MEPLEEYIEKLTTDILQLPIFANLPPEKKQGVSENLKTTFYRSIVEALISNLNETQVDELLKLDINSPQMEEKIEYFSAQIPGFMTQIEEALNNKAEKIKHSSETLHHLLQL